MKNKIFSIITIVIFIFISLISVNAIANTPKVELDEYELTSNSIDNVYVSGTVNLAVGQLVGVYDPRGIILYNYTQLPNSNSPASFKLKIPARYLTNSTNTFKVKSLPLNGVINGSNPKTVTVKINSIKQNQTITANNLTIKVNEKRNLNAKVSSNLPLTYVVKNQNIATIDANGTIIGRKEGTTELVITQSGNSTYNPVTKNITITVSNSSIIDISKIKISNINNSYVWLSKAVKPVPKLIYNNIELKQNIDYTVSYKNNKEPGTGKITINCKGKYRGTITKAFNIYINDNTSIKPKKAKSHYKVITLSGRTFRLYKQQGAFYSKWKFNYNNKSTIKGNGCGPVAIADIMSGYGYDKHPGEVAKEATSYAKKMYKQGIAKKKSCKGKTAWARYLRSYGFNAIVHTNIKESNAVAEQNIKNALKKGHQIWFQVGKGNKKKYWRKFTASGFHNIALLGIDKSGKYAYVANSSGSSKKWCKISDLSKARLKYANRAYGYIEIWKPVE